MKHKWEVIDKWANGVTIYQCTECKHGFSTRWFSKKEIKKRLNADNCDEIIAYKAIQRLSN